MARKKILVADDDHDNFILAMDALKEAGLECDLCWVRDGEELLDYLYHRTPYEDRLLAPVPDLILLDLNMPKKTGHEALKEIKADPELSGIPVVVLTVSGAKEDMERSYALGAISFIRKPHNFDRLVESMKELGRYL